APVTPARMAWSSAASASRIASYGPAITVYATLRPVRSRSIRGARPGTAAACIPAGPALVKVPSSNAILPGSGAPWSTRCGRRVSAAALTGTGVATGLPANGAACGGAVWPGGGRSVTWTLPTGAATSASFGSPPTPSMAACVSSCSTSSRTRAGPVIPSKVAARGVTEISRAGLGGPRSDRRRPPRWPPVSPRAAPRAAPAPVRSSRARWPPAASRRSAAPGWADRDLIAADPLDGRLCLLVQHLEPHPRRSGHPEQGGRPRRHGDQPRRVGRTAIVDPDLNLPPVVEIGDAGDRRQWQGLVRRRQRIGIVRLAVGGQRCVPARIDLGDTGLRRFVGFVGVEPDAVAPPCGAYHVVRIGGSRRRTALAAGQQHNGHTDSQRRPENRRLPHAAQATTAQAR